MSTQIAGKPGIYSIRQISADRIVYVGSSFHADERLLQHRQLLQRGRHSNPDLQRIYKKCGGLDFEFKTVEICPTDELTEKERGWIEKLNPLCNSKKTKAKRKRAVTAYLDSNFIRKPFMWDWRFME